MRPGHGPVTRAAAPLVTRFAPSPTGAMHLGHAYSAVRAHRLVGDAPVAGGTLILRIDDIDRERCRDSHVAGIRADLDWLGIRPDDLIVQSARQPLYDDALARLDRLGLAYPCRCTRADLLAAAAAAPHGPPGHATAPVHTGPCPRLTDNRDPAAPVAWRLRMAEAIEEATATGPLAWTALGPGGTVTPVAARPQDHGDIVLARKGLGTSYHLSSVVDDAACGISHVVRGMDLAPATSVHVLLHRLLRRGDAAFPIHLHHRLVVDADGRRLAKRDRAATLAAMRGDGIDGHALADRLANDVLPIGFALADA